MTIEKEVKMGVKDEMDHTSSKKVAKKIAKDHLKKDPKYYTKLKKAGLEEATLGGEKYKGKENPNNEKKFNIIQKIMGKKKNAQDEKEGKYMNYDWEAKTAKTPHKTLRAKQARKAATMRDIKEATLGGAKLAGKENPNNVKSKKSGFTINTKMNDAYSKVPDAKGLVRKRLLQKGKAAWNVGHAKKLAEEENLQEGPFKGIGKVITRAKAAYRAVKADQKIKNLGKGNSSFSGDEFTKAHDEKKRNVKIIKRLGGKVHDSLKEENLQEAPSKNPAAQKAKSYANAHYRKANNAFDRGDDREMENQDNKYQAAQKTYKKALKKKQNLQELSKDTLKSYVSKAVKNANRDKGIRTAKDKIWRKNAQDDYDGPNRDGKKASDGVRHTGD